MQNVASIFFGLLAAVVLVYVLARVGSIAHFRSKAEFEKERRERMEKFINGEHDA